MSARGWARVALVLTVVALVWAMTAMWWGALVGMSKPVSHAHVWTVFALGCAAFLVAMIASVMEDDQ